MRKEIKNLIAGYTFVVVAFSGMMLYAQQSQKTPGVTTKPELTEVQKLRAQAQQLKEQVFAASLQAARCNVALTQAQAQSTSNSLATDRRTLDEELIKALGGDPAKQDLDPETLQLKDKPAPAKQ